jgi:hypothetical protein
VSAVKQWLRKPMLINFLKVAHKCFYEPYMPQADYFLCGFGAVSTRTTAAKSQTTTLIMMKETVIDILSCIGGA